MEPEEVKVAREFAEKYLGCLYKKGTVEGTVVGYCSGVGGGVIIGGNNLGNMWKVLGRDDILINDGCCSYAGYYYVEADKEFIIDKDKNKKTAKKENKDTITGFLERFKDIDKIILNDKATIVILKTGEKGIVKPCEDEVLDERVGILEAYIKANKIYMNTLKNPWGSSTPYMFRANATGNIIIGTSM